MITLRTSKPSVHETHPEPGRRFRSLMYWLVLLHSLLAVGAVQAAIFTVNSTDDDPDNNPGDGNCRTGQLIVSGPFFLQECTLRAAMEEANSDTGMDEIRFSSVLPMVAGVVEIYPSSQLPVLFNPVLIDGYSHPDYNSASAHPIPIINLIGTNAGANASGLAIVQGADDSTIRGLAISQFDGDGILLANFFAENGPANVRIDGNHLGVWRGAFYNGNGRDGIGIYNSENTTIGKRCGVLIGCPGVGNTISGNTRHGVHFEGESGGAHLDGNFIGTDRFGLSTSPPLSSGTANGVHGVDVTSQSYDVNIGSIGAIFDFITGTSIPVAGGNLISGNGGSGIHAIGDYQINVRANKIGTNVTGTAALPNQDHGIYTEGGFATSFLGETGLSQNLISGNGEHGIFCDGGDPGIIAGNAIGTNLAQDAAIPNGGHGVNVICEVSIRTNVIGGNTLSGIRNDRLASIRDNWIGTNAAGNDLGNGQHGVFIDDNGSQMGAVGLPGQGNRIGFNASDGIYVSGTSIDIEANYIGTDELFRNLGNGRHGVHYVSSANVDLGDIDGLTNGAGNIIGFNGSNGVRLTIPINGPSVEIYGNYIGTNANGDDLGNNGSGIFSTTNGVTIGAPLGAADADVERYGNVIGHNGIDGIRLAAGTMSPMRGNLFFANASQPIDLGAAGVTPNDFGDTDTGANNLQNAPEFDLAMTQYDIGTGDIEVRYRVDSNLGDAVYPIKVDFFVKDPWLEPGDQARVYIGSDDYPAVSASAFRSVAITPLPGTVVPNSLGFVFEGLVATATDANGNTSELSVQAVPVPEPASGALLSAGTVLLLGLTRIFGRREGEAA